MKLIEFYQFDIMHCNFVLIVYQYRQGREDISPISLILPGKTKHLAVEKYLAVYLLKISVKS